jgi:hypothetical protein
MPTNNTEIWYDTRNSKSRTPTLLGSLHVALVFGTHAFALNVRQYSQLVTRVFYTRGRSISQLHARVAE